MYTMVKSIIWIENHVLTYRLTFGNLAWSRRPRRHHYPTDRRRRCPRSHRYISPLDPPERKNLGLGAQLLLYIHVHINFRGQKFKIRNTIYNSRERERVFNKIAHLHVLNTCCHNKCLIITITGGCNNERLYTFS